MKFKPILRGRRTIMNALCRSPILVLTVFGVATFLSMLRNLSSTRRAISLSQDLYSAGRPGNDQYVSSSNQHYRWDEELETKYSTTHQKLRGKFSQILNDRDETHSHTNDFQHKGILRTSSEKHGKWTTIRWMRPDAELMIAGETVHKAGTNYSKYVEDTRLVIDVNHTIVFPSIEKGPTRISGEPDDMHLCHVLRLVTGRNNLGVGREQGTPPVVLNISANCGTLNQDANGQAAAILALYRLRMTTALSKVDFRFHCTDNYYGSNFPNNYMKDKARKLQWVFPWFASHQPSSDDTEAWPYRGDAPTEDQMCYIGNGNDRSNQIIPFETMADQIRDDVRKMALQLTGSYTKDPKRTHPLIPLDVEPWISGFGLDDVIIHFPCCSDVVRDSTTTIRDRVGMMQFHEYTKYIHKTVKTIGIIREEKSEKEDVCYRASILLEEYLQSFYAKASISIYEDDALPLQYARIAMAKQSFSSFSDFGMIPIIGTFGEGYFQPSSATRMQGAQNQNSIVQKIVSGHYEGFENLHVMNGRILTPERIDAMDFSDLAKWLVMKP